MRRVLFFVMSSEVETSLHSPAPNSKRFLDFARNDRGLALRQNRSLLNLVCVLLKFLAKDIR